VKRKEYTNEQDVSKISVNGADSAAGILTLQLHNHWRRIWGQLKLHFAAASALEKKLVSVLQMYENISGEKQYYFITRMSFLRDS